VEARLALMDDALTCSLEELLVHSLDQAEQLSGSCFGFLHVVLPGEQQLSLQAWSTRTAPGRGRGGGGGGAPLDPIDQAGRWADGIRRRRPVIHDDGPLTTPRGIPPGHAALIRQLVVPVFRQGRIVATLAVGNKATAYTEVDVALVSRLADLAWEVAEGKQARDRLRESDARFAAAFERAPMMMMLSSFEDGRFLGVNQRFVELSGYSRAEAVGRTSVELGWISPDDRARIRDQLRTERRVGGLDLELRARSGKTILARFWGELFTAAGQTCLLSIVQDVTEAQALQRQLAQALRLESVGRLAGGVAHDFNNMLSVIMGHADLLLGQAAPADPLREDLEEIRDAAARAAVMTRQLLVFARQQVVAPRVLDLNQTVAAMLKMLRRLIGEDVDLQWTPGHELRPVRIDPSQVDQVLANLCVNARDAIVGVGRIAIGTANVELDAAACARLAGLAPGPHVRLTVSDDGAGIDPAVLPHIFEPFFTTKERGQGTGLGLATVHGIVTQNHGAIEVEGAPKQGATFHLYLPASAEGPADSPQVAALAAQGGHETVLLVEDEGSLLKLCTGLLTDLGYRVLPARGPVEAVHLAARHAGQLQLLLTDLVMPDMSGRDLATMLLLGHPGLRCLYMSGHTGETLARYGVTGKDAVFLPKPFTREELAAKVREALSRPAPVSPMRT
jgi:PAS domain S-box-containing protein